jgi:hypothetical protein
MKKTILSVFVLISVCCFGQQSEGVVPSELTTENPYPHARRERTSINVGVLMGGGGLIGADLEFLVSPRVGLQIGGGLGSVGFGVNYHFKHFINSPFVSLAYWHQGFGDNHYASYVGPMYVFRARKILQFGIGFATVLSKGAGWDRAWENKKEPTGNVALLYNIGLYFPL